MILVLGTRKQYEVDAVCTELEKETDIVIIDFLEQRAVSLELRSSTPGQSVFYIGDTPLMDVSIVWPAVRILTPKFGNTPEWAAEVVSAEQWRAVYRNIQILMADRTLNGIDAVNKGYNKLYQLIMAERAGFFVPPTLVSNSRQRLRSFMAHQGPSITKSLGDPHYPKLGDGVYQQALMTSPADPDMLDETSAYEPFPVLVQKNISKSYELRVMVVGSIVFAFKINPFQHDIMNTDYRRGGMMVDYVRVAIEGDLLERILTFHNTLGLFSASYDFIVSVDHTVTFLEVNPFGAWAYLDNLEGGRISRAITSEILKLFTANED